MDDRTRVDLTHAWLGAILHGAAMTAAVFGLTPEDYFRLMVGAFLDDVRPAEEPAPARLTSTIPPS